MTIGGKIRNMNEKEMAEFLSNIKTGYDITFGDYINFGNGEIVSARNADIKDEISK